MIVFFIKYIINSSKWYGKFMYVFVLFVCHIIICKIQTSDKQFLSLDFLNFGIKWPLNYMNCCCWNNQIFKYLTTYVFDKEISKKY